MTASVPASLCASIVPAAGSHYNAVGDVDGRRTAVTTVWPAAVRRGSNAEPINPDAPVTRTFIRCEATPEKE